MENFFRSAPSILTSSGSGSSAQSIPQSLPRVPPPAHGASMVKRPHHEPSSGPTSILMMDSRSRTPDGRRDASPAAGGFWRPPSLSPKHQSSVYGHHTIHNKGFDGRTSAPPAAHQNSSSPSPVRGSSASPASSSLHHPIINHHQPIPHSHGSSPSSSSRVSRVLPHESPVHNLNKVRSDNSDVPSRIQFGSAGSDRSKSHNPHHDYPHQQQSQNPSHAPHHIPSGALQLHPSHPHPIYSPIPGYPVQNGQMSPLRTNGSSSNSSPAPGVIITSSHPQQTPPSSTRSNFMSVDSLISKPSTTRADVVITSSASGSSGGIHRQKQHEQKPEVHHNHSHHKSSKSGQPQGIPPPVSHWSNPVRAVPRMEDMYPARVNNRSQPGVMTPYGPSGLIPIPQFQPNHHPHQMALQYNNPVPAVHLSTTSHNNHHMIHSSNNNSNPPAAHHSSRHSSSITDLKNSRSSRPRDTSSSSETSSGKKMRTDDSKKSSHNSNPQHTVDMSSHNKEKGAFSGVSHPHPFPSGHATFFDPQRIPGHLVQNHHPNFNPASFTSGPFNQQHLHHPLTSTSAAPPTSQSVSTFSPLQFISNSSSGHNKHNSDPHVRSSSHHPHHHNHQQHHAHHGSSSSSSTPLEIESRSSTSSASDSLCDSHHQYLMKVGGKSSSTPADPKTTSVKIEGDVSSSCPPGLSHLENSNLDLQVPSTSVSPTNSTHSTHSNSGGHKFLKKFWAQKYQDTSSHGVNPTDNNHNSSADVSNVCSPDTPAAPHGTSSVTNRNMKTVLSENGIKSATDCMMQSSKCDSNNSSKSSSTANSCNNNSSNNSLNGAHETNTSNSNANSKPSTDSKSNKKSVKHPKKSSLESSGDTTASGSDGDNESDEEDESKCSNRSKSGTERKKMKKKTSTKRNQAKSGRGLSTKPNLMKKGEAAPSSSSAPSESTTSSAAAATTANTTGTKRVKKSAKGSAEGKEASVKSIKGSKKQKKGDTCHQDEIPSHPDAVDDDDRPQEHDMSCKKTTPSHTKKSTGNMESAKRRKVDSDQTDLEDNNDTPSETTTVKKESVGNDVKPVAAKRGRKPKVKKMEEGDTTSQENKSSKKENVASGKGDKKQHKTPSLDTSASGKQSSSSSLETSNGSKATIQRKSSTSAKSVANILNEPCIDFSGNPFLQNMPCTDLVPSGKDTWTSDLAKCRECRMTATQKKKKDVGPSIFCRFYQFRKLIFSTKDNELKADGFSKPDDAKDEDFHLWLRPQNVQSSHEMLKKEDAEFLIKYVGDHFCTLVDQERKACSLHMGPPKILAWKSVVAGVREMCDICETTLFNIHWVCSECGFVVCIDCYRTRKSKEQESIVADEKSASSDGTSVVEKGTSRDRDRYNWLLCNSKNPHEQKKLILTHIIAKSALWDVCHDLHRVKEYLGHPCKCDNDEFPVVKFSNGIDYHFRPAVKNKNPNNGSIKIESKDRSDSPLSILADVALLNTTGQQNMKSDENDASSSQVNKDESSALRDLLSKPTPPSSQSSTQSTASSTKKKNSKKVLSTQLNGVLAHDNEDDADNNGDVSVKKLDYFCRKIIPVFRSKNLASRVCSIKETSKEFPDIPHDWFCDGRLLVLKDTGVEKNLLLFEQQWVRNQPVMICKVQDWLERELWKPTIFKSKFSDVKYEFTDTETLETVNDQPLKRFWEGFDNPKNRQTDSGGRAKIYKIKDWPPGEDFSDALPEQFGDLMSCIPMPEYTTHEGVRNLAVRLPKSFGLIPDLGPKMYTAYGMASDKMGTTNLHLDISDAVNIMVHVASFKPKKEEEDHQQKVIEALKDAGVESNQIKRLENKKEKAGAIWHIYDARDADKIRNLLNRELLERKIKLKPHHDPIHDQSFYLDKRLRQRLKDTEGVEGYTILQCHGDAIFIPAGAPHQVRNLSSCIKVAEDFVSPENVAHCFNLTEEFRQLSDTHDNHEDKLQIKNIIYHTVKDAIHSFSPLLKDNNNQHKNH